MRNCKLPSLIGMLFCLCFCALVHNVVAIEIVSLGGACNVARAARYNNMRKNAYPFDWTITSMHALKAAFDDDFSQILMLDQMRESEDGKSVVDGYRLVYIHDFSTVRYPIAPEDSEIMPVHQLLPNWRDSIDIVKAKFTRRLDRLLNLLRIGQPVALVRYNEMDRNEAEKFVQLLKKKFPNAKVVLVVLGTTQEFKESWNLTHVHNLYIDEKDFSVWNGSAWSEAMQVIAHMNPTGWSNAGAEEAPYVLTSPLYNPGLFSVFNTVIGALNYYDQGMISGLRVDFGNQGWYFDVARGNNWWNYCFEPIILGDSNDKESENLFPTYQKIAFAYDAQFEMSRERAHELIQKYVRLRPHITEHIDSFWNQYCAGSFVIGVHYRGTDKLECDSVSYDIVIKHIQAVIAAHAEECIKIFVATDDAHFATYIHEQFPQQLVMRHALRSDSLTGVHMRTDLDSYQKGEDVVIDCLLLSRCSVLIKMASNVSDCSLQFNPNIQVIRLNKSYSE